MNFLLDVHLSKSLAKLLEADGHTCRLVVEVGNPKMNDIGHSPIGPEKW